jgi:hypothetical protein
VICKNQFWIAVSGIIRGTIKFEIEVNPRMRAITARPTVVDRTNQISESIGQQVVSMLTTEGSLAQAVKNAFICYAHDDWHRVAYLAEALEASGINVWIDALEMKREPDWTKQAQNYVRDADIAYVCWSAAASVSDSVTRQELAWIHKKLIDDPKNFDVVLCKLEDIPAPSWLEIEEGRFSKRWKFFRAGMREEYEERPGTRNPAI